MKCPSCKSDITLLKNPGTLIRFFFRKSASCPCCRTPIYGRTMPIRDYIESILFVILLVGLVLFFLALLAGLHIGMSTAAAGCLFVWAAAIGVFLVILLANFLFICLGKLYSRVRQKLTRNRKLL